MRFLKHISVNIRRVIDLVINGMIGYRFLLNLIIIRQMFGVHAHPVFIIPSLAPINVRCYGNMLNFEYVSIVLLCCMLLSLFNLLLDFSYFTTVELEYMETFIKFRPSHLRRFWLWPIYKLTIGAVSPTKDQFVLGLNKQIFN